MNSDVTGTESGLVCAWDFTTVVEDVTNIPDKTGKHVAKIVGNYKWLKLRTNLNKQTKSMKNNTIKIKAFLCLLLLTCGWVSVQAQQVLTVKGVVVDALKEPLPGASVQVVGMSTGTVTDLDGNFSLQVPKGKTIAVSFIGYVTQELTVNQNQSNLTIQLKMTLNS